MLESSSPTVFFGFLFSRHADIPCAWEEGLMAFLVMLVSLLLREVPYREVPHTLLMAFLFMLISLLLMEVSFTALSLRNPMILSASARGAPGCPPCSGGA